MNKILLGCVSSVFCLTSSLFADGVVPPGTTMLNDSGSSSNPALWYLNADYTAPDTGTFSIGGPNASYNYLSVVSNQTFNAPKGLTMGASWSSHNRLDVSGGGNVNVTGNLLVGPGSVMYYTEWHKILVSGTGSKVSITGNLDMSNGYNATDSALQISDGGLVVVDSDRDSTGSFSLYSHYTYGNCWLDFDGGMLAIYGDSTDNFEPNASNILASIRVWDDVTSAFHATADFFSSSQPPAVNSYYQMLDVDYIDTATTAAQLGISEDLVGFTVLRNTVPEPGAMILFALGALIYLRHKRF